MNDREYAIKRADDMIRKEAAIGNSEAMMFLLKQKLVGHKQKYTIDNMINFLEDVIADPDGLNVDYVDFHEGLRPVAVSGREREKKVVVTLNTGQVFELRVTEVMK